MSRQGANKKTKKIFVSCLIFLGIFTTFFTIVPSNVAGWDVSRITDGEYTSLAVDSNGKAHISYLYSGLKYVTNASGSWVTYSIDSQGANDTSIAVDLNDKVHIAYPGTTAGLRYATNASGSWILNTIDNTGNSLDYTSIALDSNNKVHISYVDRINRDLKYATNVVGSWATYIIDSAGDVGMGSGIAIDSNNHVHISYADMSNDLLKYATNISGSWETFTIDNNGTSGSLFTSIAIDSNDKVHISYQANGSNQLKYATNASGSWETYVITSANIGPYCVTTSIAIDLHNRVHISYLKDDDLYYASNASGSWRTCTVDSYSQSGMLNKIAIDPFGRVHIGYMDYGNSDLRYASSSYVVNTDPLGLQIAIDDLIYYTPYVFDCDWTAGSTHTLNALPQQNVETETRYVFTSWSDGGDQTHGVTVPSSSMIYTANFATQYMGALAYITNEYSDSVSVIDTSTNTVVTTIPVGDAPHGITINPLNKEVYVANYSSNTVSVIDTSTNTVIASIEVSGNPYGASVTPDGSKVYVTKHSGSVSVIDTAANTVLGTIPMTGNPHGVAISPDGTRAYVTNFGNDYTAVIDTATNTVVTTIPVGDSPQGIAIHPSGSRVYVGNRYGNSISVIDATANTVIATVPGVLCPNGVVMNSAGTKLYAAGPSSLDGPTSSAVYVIDTSTNTVAATITLDATDEGGVSLTPDGSRLYVAQRQLDRVVVIDTTNNTVIGTVTVGSKPFGFGNFILGEVVAYPDTPNGPTVGTTDTAYTYSAGGASSNFGHSVQYFFDWGDGTNSGWLPVGTTSASHSWSSAGTYTVKAQARCATHTSIVSGWSGSLSVVIETVSTPSTPSGPTIGILSVNYTYSTGGSSSDLSHSVQYFFNWGDGTNSGWLPVGTTSVSKSWPSVSTYGVKVQARCAIHTFATSPWSEIFSISIVIKPGAASLISPSGTIADTTPTYIWNPVSMAADYCLWVSNSTGTKVKQWYSSTAAGCASGTGTCSVTPTTALPLGSATWQIQAKNIAGIGPWSSGMSFTVSLPDPPVVTSFKISAGAASTVNNAAVTLNNTATNKPTHYMASESPTFDGAIWEGYSPAPSFALSSGSGTKTVHFKVKNTFGESAAVSDTIITLAPVVTSFEISAGALGTAKGTVTLNNVATNSPTHCMASESDTFSGATWQAYAIAPTFLLSTGTVMKRVYFKVRNSFAESEVVYDQISTMVPVVTSFKINSGAASTAKGMVALNNATMYNPTHYMASEDLNFVGGSWQAYSTAPTFALSAGSGTKTIYFRVKNSFGESAVVYDDIFASGLLPAVTSFKINAGALNTVKGTVTLNNTATNYPIAYMASEDSNFNGATWQTYSTAPSFALSSGSGTKKVYFKVENIFGESAVVSDTILAIPPAVTSFNISAGALSTVKGTVMLNNVATNTPTQFMASELYDFAGASWQTYSTAPSFTLSAGSGTKTIYFKVKNSFEESTVVSDTIMALAPTVTSFKISAGALSTVKGTVTLTNISTNLPTHFMASEASDFTGASWQAYSTAPSFTLSAGSGTRTVYFKVKNSFDESNVANDTISALAPAVASFKISAGVSNTANGTVTLNNVSTNSPTHYMASEDSGFNGASWQSYSTAPKFTLSDGAGTKTVYFKVKNSLDESSFVTDTISTSGLLPVVTSFKISAGALSTAKGTVTLNNVTTNWPTYYMASEDPDFVGATWQAYITAPSFVISSGTGMKTVYFKVKNGFGESFVVNDTIAVLVPSVTSFRINAGSSSTAAELVTLNNTATNVPTHYMVSEASDFSGASWQSYTTAPKFNLSSDFGTKTIYFKVKNAFDESAVVSDTIFLY